MKKIRDLVSLMAKRLEFLESVQLNGKKSKKLNFLPNFSSDCQDHSTFTSQKSLKKNSKFPVKQDNSIPDRKASERKSERFDMGEGNKIPKFFFKSPQHLNENRTFGQPAPYLTPKRALSPVNNSHCHLRMMKKVP